MLQLKNIAFSYNDKPVLSKISFDLQPGEQLSIIGESGSGKSTLLKLIYGLLQPANGTVSWKGEKLLGPDFHLVPGEPFMKYQAQDYDLMPSETVSENIGKFLSNFYPRKKKKRIEELLELVEMSEYAHQKPPKLSGGQQQRVALAKVLAKEPELLLLDEPFSNIDNFKKNGLRRKLFNYLKEQNIACIVATHDNADSLSFSDRTLVLKNGKKIALENPVHLYQNPKNLYTTRLFGEVNEILASHLGYPEKKKVLIYPHELFPANDGLEVKILNSYFEGNGFMTEGVSGRKKIYFKSLIKPENGEVLYLNTDHKLIENRISKQS